MSFSILAFNEKRMRRIIILLGLVALMPVACFSQTSGSKNVFLSYKDYPPIREKRTWGYQHYIISFKEPSIWVSGRGYDEIYRFIFCPTSDSIPALLVTIKRKGEIVTIETKQSGAMGGYIVTQSAFDTKRILTPKEWSKFKRLFDQSNYWKVPQFIERNVIDGDECAMEALVNGRYRYVCRDTPDGFADDKPLADLFFWMVNLVPEQGVLETCMGGVNTNLDTGVIFNSGKPATMSTKGKR